MSTNATLPTSTDGISTHTHHTRAIQRRSSWSGTNAIETQGRINTSANTCQSERLRRIAPY